MKMSKILVVILLIAVIVIGWLALVSADVSENSEYTEAVETANDWYERGLYLRAAGKYEQAIAMESTEELWQCLVACYEGAYGENAEDTYSDYANVLKRAVNACPGNYDFYMSLAMLYLEKEDYSDSYVVLMRAKENGLADEAMEELLLTVKYSFEIRKSEYEVYGPYAGEAYPASGSGAWRNVDYRGNMVSDDYSDYLGPLNADGIQVVTRNDQTRIQDADGITLGIFKDVVWNAGLFSEGLVAAESPDGSYYYYNDLADVVLGPYEAAGSFRNGTAAVMMDGKWYIIDTVGEPQSGPYADIVLDPQGVYNRYGVIVAAEKEGSYCLYDENWEKIGDFTADSMDFCAADGILAFEDNGKWGFVSKEGTVLVEPKYDSAKSFSNGLAAVCEDGLWGFIDPNGVLVIEYQFLGADYFNESGSCMVCTEIIEPVILVELEELSETEEGEEAEESSESQETDGAEESDESEQEAEESDSAAEEVQAEDSADNEAFEADGGEAFIEADGETSELSEETEEPTYVWRLLLLYVGEE